MKIRIRDNTLRLRLTQSEVIQLAQSGKVCCTTDFGEGMMFTYQICKNDSITEIKADFKNAVVTVSVPGEKTMHWASSEQVSLLANQNNQSASPLRVQIEKDFACLIVREGEDDSDAFPNPNN